MYSIVGVSLSIGCAHAGTLSITNQDVMGRQRARCLIKLDGKLVFGAMIPDIGEKKSSPKGIIKNGEYKTLEFYCGHGAEDHLNCNTKNFTVKETSPELEITVSKDEFGGKLGCTFNNENSFKD